MSTSEDKIKHSSRRFKDEVAIHRQAKIAKSYGVDIKEEHRYNKHHAMDCGNPECHMCGNPRHIHKDGLTKQEKSFNQSKLYEE